MHSSSFIMIQLKPLRSHMLSPHMASPALTLLPGSAHQPTHATHLLHTCNLTSYPYPHIQTYLKKPPLRLRVLGYPDTLSQPGTTCLHHSKPNFRITPSNTTTCTHSRHLTSIPPNHQPTLSTSDSPAHHAPTLHLHLCHSGLRCQGHPFPYSTLPLN